MNQQAFMAEVLEAATDAVRADIELWAEEFLPLHFEESAFRRYGYEKRQGQRFGPGARMGWTYHYRKLARLHHYRPLSYTGQLQDAAERYEIRARTFGMSAEAEYLADLPDYFWKRRPRKRPRGDEGIAIDKVKELLETDTPEELRARNAVAMSVFGERFTRALVVYRLAALGL
jgi:hypothetical protein